MSNTYTCEYCGTCQKLTTVWACIKCGAPLAPKEKPTLIQRVLGSAMSEDNAQGIDISKWQGDMNFSVTKQAADFVIAKASENVWEDSKYDQNVIGLQEYDIIHGVYHFCRPEYGWQAQAEFFADRVVGQMPAWADIERTGGLSPDALQKWLYNFVSLVEDKTGYPVGIYCRGLWWNTYVGRNNWAGSHPLWIARYSDYLEGPWSDGKYKPYEWDTWALWQWSADGNGEGALYGAQSNSIDKNWFNGTKQEFLDWLNMEPEPPTEPCDCDAINDRITAIEVRVQYLENSITQAVSDVENNEVDIIKLKDRVSKLEYDTPVDGSVRAIVIGDKAVAFSIGGYNNVDKPIMVKYEPVVRAETGDTIYVWPEKIDADGSIDYYKWKHPISGIYVRADKIQI